MKTNMAIFWIGTALVVGIGLGSFFGPQNEIMTGREQVRVSQTDGEKSAEQQQEKADQNTTHMGKAAGGQMSANMMPPEMMQMHAQMLADVRQGCEQMPASMKPQCEAMDGQMQMMSSMLMNP